MSEPPSNRPSSPARSEPPSARALLTAEEYACLPDEDGYRDELSRGRLVREPQPQAPHGRVQLNVGAELRLFVKQHGLGYVTVESGYILERNPDTVRGPDVAFVARERYGETLPERWPEFGPDLAVEVLSPSDRVSRMAEKVAQYFGAGTRLVWVIDPEERTATVFRSPIAVRVLGESDELDGEDVLPGFRIRVADVLD